MHSGSYGQAEDTIGSPGTTCYECWEQKSRKGSQLLSQLSLLQAAVLLEQQCEANTVRGCTAWLSGTESACVPGVAL